MVEYLPLRRMLLQKDQSWRTIRWPLPLGERRDIPGDVTIHVSAIRRLELNPTFDQRTWFAVEKEKRKLVQATRPGTGRCTLIMAAQCEKHTDVRDWRTRLWFLTPGPKAIASELLPKHSTSYSVVFGIGRLTLFAFSSREWNTSSNTLSGHIRGDTLRVH